MNENTGEYASLDELAGQVPDQGAALGIASLILDALTDGTDLQRTEIKVVGPPVNLASGSAVVTTLLNVDGVEYEIFVRQAP